jgi:hypothetical protein
MDTNAIREAILKRPFKPFTLRMNDGRQFYIPHPEYVAVSRRVMSVIDHVSEAAVYLEPILISSLQYEDGEPSGNAEGGRP